MGNLQKNRMALLQHGEAEGVTWPSIGRPRREQSPNRELERVENGSAAVSHLSQRKSCGHICILWGLLAFSTSYTLVFHKTSFLGGIYYKDNV